MGCTPSSSKTLPAKQARKFQPIPDRFHSIAQVQAAIREAGLESSNLILGVDFTKSNVWTGRESFGGRSLHDTTGPIANPYEQVIDVVGRTLEEFDDDRLIPAYGFGDATTGDRKCFPFHANDEPSRGVQEVLLRYRQIAQSATLAGPTSFAPVIHQAIELVKKEESYHILVIVADGQVTDASPEGETARAIIEASHYPLSIVVVGVGDGPWDAMETYDDELPQRKFDNFQFVDFNRVIIESGDTLYRKQGEYTEAMLAQFALTALMEIPDQYSFIKEHRLLNTATFPRRSTRSVLAPSLAVSMLPSVVVPPPSQAPSPQVSRRRISFPLGSQTSFPLENPPPLASNADLSQMLTRPVIPQLASEPDHATNQIATKHQTEPPPYDARILQTHEAAIGDTAPAVMWA